MKTVDRRSIDTSLTGHPYALAALVHTKPELCQNCHACIGSCPVKYCNLASSDHVSINHDLCIGCGACVDICRHKARLPVDDSEAFWEDLKRGQPMVAIVAPAIAAAYPDHYMKLNGWLRRMWSAPRK